MKSLLRYALALAAIVNLASCSKKGPPLYQDTVSIKAQDGQGKDLVMSLNETERHEKYSIVKVQRTSGASVPSIMFVVKGCWAIAKLRGEEYFINLKEWTDPQGNRVYKIGFAHDKTVDPKAYFGDDIDSTKESDFMSVEDFDLLFEPRD